MQCLLYCLLLIDFVSDLWSINSLLVKITVIDSDAIRANVLVTLTFTLDVLLGKIMNCVNIVICSQFAYSFHFSLSLFFVIFAYMYMVKNTGISSVATFELSAPFQSI